MMTLHTDRPPDPLRLVRGLIRGGGPSISLPALVSGWMALHLSAQLLFEQLGSLLLLGDLALVHDPENTRVSLSSPPDKHRACCRSECLSPGETVEFAAAVSQVHCVKLDVVQASRKASPFQVPRPLDLAQAPWR